MRAARFARSVLALALAAGSIADDARAQSKFGTSCAGASGVTPTIAVSGSIAAGETWSLSVVAPGGLGLGYLILGFSNTSAISLAGANLPLDMGTLFGDPLWSGCPLSVDPGYLIQPYTFDPLSGGGVAWFTFPGFDDGTVFAQAFNIDPDFGSHLAGVSRGVEIVPSQLVPGLVPIPAGTFEMGSDAASGAPYFPLNDESPHTVTITSGFWIAEHEVTQAEYASVTGTNPSSFAGADLPVDSVSWDEARAYCVALTAIESAAGNLPSGFVYRLPTEAEWEYACRAGSTTEFAVGDALLCVHGRFGYSYHSNSFCGSFGTVPVGSYTPNAWNLFDMHGNVSEWCLDSYAAYPTGAVTDPHVTGGTNRIVRGGNWLFYSQYARSAARGIELPDERESNIGFRVVLAPLVGP